MWEDGRFFFYKYWVKIAGIEYKKKNYTKCSCKQKTYIKSILLSQIVLSQWMWINITKHVECNSWDRDWETLSMSVGGNTCWSQLSLFIVYHIIYCLNILFYFQWSQYHLANDILLVQFVSIKYERVNTVDVHQAKKLHNAKVKSHSVWSPNSQHHQ